jgi:HAD superfamily hydrolase (TIGR01509 family)
MEISNNKQKVIVFDMDGVLFDSVAVGQAMFIENHPGTTGDDYRNVQMGNFHEETKKFLLLKVVRTEDERVAHNAAYSVKKSQVPMYEGMKELVEALHAAGTILVLNTSAHEANCLPMLERAGILPLFDFVADANVSKSKVEKFDLIEKKYGVKKEEMIFVTDSLGDLREADIAGVPTVVVTWGIHDVSYFKNEPHDCAVAIVETVAELQNYLFTYCDLKNT